MQMRRPVGINQTFLYYKYLIRGDEANNSAFLDDYQIFLDEFDTARKAGQNYRDDEEHFMAHEMAPYGKQRALAAKKREDDDKTADKLWGEKPSVSRKPAGPKVTVLDDDDDDSKGKGEADSMSVSLDEDEMEEEGDKDTGLGELADQIRDLVAELRKRKDDPPPSSGGPPSVPPGPPASGLSPPAAAVKFDSDMEDRFGKLLREQKGSHDRDVTLLGAANDDLRNELGRVRTELDELRKKADESKFKEGVKEEAAKITGTPYEPSPETKKLEEDIKKATADQEKLVRLEDEFKSFRDEADAREVKRQAEEDGRLKRALESFGTLFTGHLRKEFPALSAEPVPVSAAPAPVASAPESTPTPPPEMPDTGPELPSVPEHGMVARLKLAELEVDAELKDRKLLDLWQQGQHLDKAIKALGEKIPPPAPAPVVDTTPFTEQLDKQRRDYSEKQEEMLKAVKGRAV